jgi:hypothetical protein
MFRILFFLFNTKIRTSPACLRKKKVQNFMIKGRVS